MEFALLNQDQARPEVATEGHKFALSIRLLANEGEKLIA
jgi:hypothetical protein